MTQDHGRARRGHVSADAATPRRRDDATTRRRDDATTRRRDDAREDADGTRRRARAIERMRRRATVETIERARARARAMTIRARWTVGLLGRGTRDATTTATTATTTTTATTAKTAKDAASTTAAATTRASPCLCRDILAAAAKRCAAAQRLEANHFCTYGTPVIGDVLNATSDKHKAFGKSHWIDGEARVSEAVRQMHLTDLSALVVMDARALDADRSGTITQEEMELSASNNAIIGILTERDYLNAVARGLISASTKVSEVMTSFRDASKKIAKLVAVSPDDSVLAAMESMTNNRLRHIPVIASKGVNPDDQSPIDPRVLGVVSIGEVLKALLAESRSEISHLESYILGLE